MSSKLIIESGSTKTKWVLLVNGEIAKEAASTGINPTVMSIDELYQALEEGYNALDFRAEIDQVYFYVAGLDSQLSRQKLEKVFGEVFNFNKLMLESDMLGACHAMCGDEPGFVAILGTGSNCTYYDGVQMYKHIPSLGYMISDEGSGNQIGKRVLRAFFYGFMDPALKASFLEKYPIDKEEVLKNLYEEAMPNQYMARFAPFAIENKHKPIIRKEIEEELDHFIKMNLVTAKNSKEYPIHFVGSIALHTKEILEELLASHGMQLGTISSNPLQLLIEYYKTK